MNDERIENFCTQLKDTAAWFRSKNFQEIILVHHNDADGLSSGAILYSAFGRERIHTRRIALEKPYPQALSRIIESIDNGKQTLLLLTDFASGMLPVIESLRPKDLSVLVLDHHQLSLERPEAVKVINPLLFNISGQKECTASTLCYLFAKELNPWNSDRAAAALVGIYGDGQCEVADGFLGLNSIPFSDAQDNGLILVEEEIVIKSKESYRLSRIVSAVNALGSVGYFEGGCDIAVKGLVDGWGIEVDTRGDEYRKRFRELTDRFCATVTLEQRGDLSWFILGEEYKAYGVKTVGLFCEEIIARGMLSGARYLLGVQPIVPVIPGVGNINISEDKVSMRTTPELRKAVELKQRKPLTEVLPPATAAIGGFIDACHPHAAATTVRSGDAAKLISEVLKII